MRSEPSTASQSDDMTAFHFNPAKSTWTLLAAAVLWTTTNILSGIKATTGRNFPSFELPTQGQRPPACFDAFIAWHVLIVASIHKIARLASWALTQAMHSISCDVGYAAFLAGMPYFQCALPIWSGDFGIIIRFMTLWYHHPLWLAQSITATAAFYLSGGRSIAHVQLHKGGGGLCTSYGGGLTKYTASSLAGGGLVFVSGGTVSGPQLIMARQVAVSSNTPGLLTYLIAAIFVPPIVVPSFLACVIVMLMAISAAACALAADFLFLFWKLATDTKVHKKIAEGFVSASTLRGHSYVLAVGSCGYPASAFRIFIFYAILLAVEAGDDSTSSGYMRMPRFDGQRTSYRQWLLAFSAYVSLRYPDLVGIIDGTRDPPTPEDDQETRDLFLRHNRQVYGAIAQCVPEWLVNTLYMSSPNNGRAALLHLRVEYGVNTSMDRAAAMAKLHRCYLDPRAAIDINHVRYQYDSMREANTDLQNAGGTSLPDAALITLLDAAIARCTAYDHIRMFVTRARHDTFTAHFNDYLQTVRSEMQMADLAGEAPQHAAAYSALPPPPGRQRGGQLSSVFNANSKGSGKGSKGGKGGKDGKGKGKHGQIGKGGKGSYAGSSGAIIMCFRCTRMGHSRNDCRQPAVRCSQCGGDHAESLHNKPDLTFGQRRALMNDAQQRRPNARAAAAIPNMSGGGESMPILTEQANDLEIDEQDTDESGAFITFAPALPTSSVGERADRDTGGESLPHLTMLSEEYEEPLSTAMFAVAVPTHLGAVPVHDRASRVFQCASSTSMVDEGAASSSSSATPHTDTPLQRLGRMIIHRQQLEGVSMHTAPEVLDAIWHVGAPDAMMVADPTKRSLTWSEMRYIGFSQRSFCRSATRPDPPAGQSEVSIAEEDSARWRRDAAESAAALHREDLHLARVNAALFQISNDVLSTSVDDVHVRAGPAFHFADRAPLQPTGDADLDRLYRSFWALESFLDETADAPTSPSDDEESGREDDVDMDVWERARLAAIHRMFVAAEMSAHVTVLPADPLQWLDREDHVLAQDARTDLWPTGFSYQTPLVDADTPSLASSASSLASPPRKVGVDGVVSVGASAMDEVLQDGDLMCIVFRYIFDAAGLICSRVDCPCTSTHNGGESGHCCRTCFRGRACTHNVHRTPFYPIPPSRPARVALVCSTWREAWDEAQTDWVKRPYPAAAHWLQGIVYDVSVRARKDVDRLSREAASRLAMGVAAPGLSTSELIASIVAQEGNLYAAARVHERRLDAAATVTPCTCWWVL